MSHTHRKAARMLFILGLLLCFSLLIPLTGCRNDGGEDTGTGTDAADPTAPVTDEPTGSGTTPETDPGTEAEAGTAAEEAMSTRPRILPADIDAKEQAEEHVTVLTPMIAEGLSTLDDLTTADLKNHNWNLPFGGTMTVETADDGNKYVRYTGMSQNWHSVAYDIYPDIKEPGTYVISFRYMLEGDIKKNASPAGFVIRANKVNDFLPQQGSNVYADLGDVPTDCQPGTWYEASYTINVSANDIAQKDNWNLCFHEIDTSVKAVCVDDMMISKKQTGDPAPVFPTGAKTWVCNEMVLNSKVTRGNAPMEAELDLILTCGDTMLTVPGFWDGGNTWRVRFALPTVGEWTWKTVCTDTSDAGLHGLSGKITCTAYDGELAVYQHGFVKTTEGCRYFTYDDGTPFLYLGDTHWNMPTEEYDSAGPRADGIKTDSHFKYIVKKRVEQGFTVYQSEPIGASFDLSNGITESDVEGFRMLDKYFAYIAKAGLTHANAEFCYPGDMESWIRKPDFDETLRVAARYWVARYGAYPVIWTLGQEVDKNFYSHFTTENNPYITLCGLIAELDAYHHPMTGHQENVSYTKCLDSSFRNVEGHTFYGVQWSPALLQASDFAVQKEYWEHGDGKLAILYESLYDHLWTNHYGARVQGWVAYLNGMYGYGYGAEDIWLYKSSYDMDTDSTQQGITVTKEDKQVHWGTAVDFESAWQVGYMGDFFSNLEWWKLTPRFNDRDWFSPKARVPYAVASDENNVYVIYLYGVDIAKSGTVKSLDMDASYTLRWFNPRTGEWSAAETITAPDGSYVLPDRPTADDWVVLLQKQSK